MNLIHTIIASALIYSSVFDHSLPKLEGGNQSLSAFQGKKLMIVTIPSTQNEEANSFLQSLDSLATIHLDSIKVIAIPSIEEGFSGTPETIHWYNELLHDSVFVASGIYTNNNSGAQHPLFAWLTNEAQNGRFEINNTGSGFKYFLNAEGALYGVITPEVKLNSAFFNKVIHAQ